MYGPNVVPAVIVTLVLERAGTGFVGPLGTFWVIVRLGGEATVLRIYRIVSPLNCHFHDQELTAATTVRIPLLKQL